MATKKVAAKKTAVPAKKAVSAQASATAKVSAPNMTKTQVIRYMAERME